MKNHYSSQRFLAMRTVRKQKYAYFHSNSLYLQDTCTLFKLFPIYVQSMSQCALNFKIQRHKCPRKSKCNEINMFWVLQLCSTGTNALQNRNRQVDRPSLKYKEGSHDMWNVCGHRKVIEDNALVGGFVLGTISHYHKNY